MTIISPCDKHKQSFASFYLIYQKIKTFEHFICNKNDTANKFYHKISYFDLFHSRMNKTKKKNAFLLRPEIYFAIILNLLWKSQLALYKQNTHHSSTSYIYAFAFWNMNLNLGKEKFWKICMSFLNDMIEFSFFFCGMNEVLVNLFCDLKYLYRFSELTILLISLLFLSVQFFVIYMVMGYSNYGLQKDFKIQQFMRFLLFS